MGYRLTGVKYYSTGSLYADYIWVFAAAPDDRLAGIVVPADREGVELVDDWDGFGQRLTGTGTTRFTEVHVSPDEPQDWAGRRALSLTVMGAFLQHFCRWLRRACCAVRRDAAAPVRRRVRSWHAPGSAGGGFAGAAGGGEDCGRLARGEGDPAGSGFGIDTALATVADGFPSPDAADEAIDRFLSATATWTFDAGGASATQAAWHLDRYWRNVLTVSTYNPTSLKATAWGIGGRGGATPQHGFLGSDVHGVPTGRAPSLASAASALPLSVPPQ